MEATSFGLANKAANDIRKLKADLGAGVKSQYENVQERIEQIEKDIESAYRLTDEMSRINAINITKAYAKLNQILKSNESLTGIFFDDLFDLSNVNMEESTDLEFISKDGVIKSIGSNTIVKLNPILLKEKAKKIMITTDDHNDSRIFFNGAGGLNYGQLPQYAITKDITLEATFKISSESSSRRVLLANLEINGYGIFFQNEKIGIYTYINGVDFVEMIDMPLELNKKYTISFTFDGTTAKLFLDGVLSKTIEKSGTLKVTNQQTVLGYNPPTTTAECFKGDILDVRIYNRVKTDEEIIRELYYPKNKAGLVLWVNPNIGGWHDLSSYQVEPTKTSNFNGQLITEEAAPNTKKDEMEISFDNVDWYKLKMNTFLDVSRINQNDSLYVKIPLSEGSLLNYYSIITE